MQQFADHIDAQIVEHYNNHAPHGLSFLVTPKWFFPHSNSASLRWFDLWFTGLGSPSCGGYRPCWWISCPQKSPEIDIRLGDLPLATQDPSRHQQDFYLPIFSESRHKPLGCHDCILGWGPHPRFIPMQRGFATFQGVAGLAPLFRKLSFPSSLRLCVTLEILAWLASW